MYRTGAHLTSLVRHPPGGPNASPDSGPQSLILTVVTVAFPRGDTHTQTPSANIWPCYIKHRLTHKPRERPPARDMPYAPQAMPALLETRGYTALRTAVLHATQSINSQGRAPVGLRPELPRLPGGRLQLTATIHVRPCSPARTNTTAFQRPSWNRQKGWADPAPYPPRDVAASHNGVTGNWQQAERRDERKKSNVCAPATPHRLNGYPAGLFRPSTDAMHSLLCGLVEKISASCSPGGDLSFLTLQLLMCNCSWRERDSACHATSFCLQNRAWSSSGWAASSPRRCTHSHGNVWPDLDHEGLPHDKSSPLSASGFSSRLGRFFSR